MARERNVRNPIVKTYIKLERSPTKNIVHARVYAHSFNLDRKGSGKNIRDAVANAITGLSIAQPQVAWKR